MNDMFERREEYYKILGEFLIEFSQMETALISYCSVISHLTNSYEGFAKHSPLSISERTKFIKNFINENITALKEDWNKINQKINTVNADRRYLIHGIGRTGLWSDTLSTMVPKSGKLLEKEFSVDDIKALISDIQDINTGENGIQGEFYTKFCTHRYNLHNENTDSAIKIVYKINGEILTKHRG